MSAIPHIQLLLVMKKFNGKIGVAQVVLTKPNGFCKSIKTFSLELELRVDYTKL